MLDAPFLANFHLPVKEPENQKWLEIKPFRTSSS